MKYEDSRPPLVNIGNLDHKYDELQIFFQDCLNAYNKPALFRARVSTLIQPLRNFTFAIQKNKHDIPDFDVWYTKWQKHLGNDEYMRWLHAKRNEVVKEDVIIGKSTAIVHYYLDHKVKLTEAYNIDESTENVIQDCMNMTKDDPSLLHAVGNFLRLYLVDVDGKPSGLMSILYGGMIFINLIYIDLRGHLDGNAPIPKNEIDQVSKMSQFDLKPLEIIFKFKNGRHIPGDFYDDQIEEEITKVGTKKAKSRIGNIRNLESRDKTALTRRTFNNCKDMLRQYKQYKPVILLHFPEQGWHVIDTFFNDRPEKMAYMQNLATYIKANGIDEIIGINEVWTVHHKDSDKIMQRIGSGKDLATLRTKGESLMLDYINKDGLMFSRMADIRRLEDGSIAVGNSRLIKAKDSDSMALYYPVLELWGLTK